MNYLDFYDIMAELDQNARVHNRQARPRRLIVRLTRVLEYGLRIRKLRSKPASERCLNFTSTSSIIPHLTMS